MNSKNNHPKVAIITLNWNTWEDTIEALESVYQSKYPNYEIIVVDNASMDNSIRKIKEYTEGQIEVKSPYIKYGPSNKPIYVVEYTKEEAEKGGLPEYEEKLKQLPSNRKLVIIKNDKNYGYPEGNNIGIRYILNKDPNREFKYILLLNNDVAVDKNWLTELVKVMEADPKVGIAGSKVLDYRHPELIQSTGGYFHWWIGWIRGINWIPDKNDTEPKERDFVWATSALFRRELFEKIGLLDSSFFFGIEEYDFCKRTQKAGYKIMYVPTSRVWHKGGASLQKVDEFPEAKKLITKEMGMFRYKVAYRLFKKHLPPILWIFPFFVFMTRRICSLTIALVYHWIRRDYEQVNKVLRRNI